MDFHFRVFKFIMPVVDDELMAEAISAVRYQAAYSLWHVTNVKPL